MVLNYIWVFFFFIAFAVALVKLIFFGDTQVFSAIMSSSFDMSKIGFEVSLGMTGVLTLWLGLMKIGEEAGIVRLLSKAINPFFHKIFPELPKDHPAFGPIMMNIAANMLGLDNAATPLGLKAMEELQKSNPQKDTATNAQIMFLVLNASGLTLIPVSIMVYRAQLGAANPSDVFIPILLATFFSTLAGFISVAIVQKINIFQKTILLYLGGLVAIVGSLMYYTSTLSPERLATVSNVASNVVLFSIIVSFIAAGFLAKLNVYATFIEGAREGFHIAVKIIPYLIAILVGIGVFRASGAMEYLTQGLTFIFSSIGVNTDFVPAIPTALMKPLSGSGARGMMVDAMTQYGADSFVGRVVCVIQGAADTTFYIIAVYFGAVRITKTRHAIGCGLIADAFGIIAAIIIAYSFFHI